MLFKRIITSLILAPLIIAGVLYLPEIYFALIWGIVILVAAWEWSNLAGLEKTLHRYLFLFGLVLSQLFMFSWIDLLEVLARIGGEALDFRESADTLDWLVVVAVVWWVVVAFAMKRNPDKLLESKASTKARLFMGWFILLMAWHFLVRLRHVWDPSLTLYLILLVSFADIAAYFVGRRFGKTKLAPDISPGKTVAGMYGAMAITLAFTLIVAFGYGFNMLVMVDFIILSQVTVMFSVYGDLFESLAKRHRGVKDSGTLIPGHGGVLDRIDGHLSAIPIFFLGIKLIILQIL